jgi:hypothetical protein
MTYQHVLSEQNLFFFVFVLWGGGGDFVDMVTNPIKDLYRRKITFLNLNQKTSLK